MKIAIVGATGMLGHHTARAVVAAGHTLTVVHRQSSDLSRLADLEYCSAIGDLNDSDSLRRALQPVDAVINCAGYYPTRPSPWQEDVTRAMQQMTNFYDACKDADLQKIVYLGGAIALPTHPHGEPGNETLNYSEAPANKNPYLKVKWAMDNQAKMMANEGLPVVIGIPSMTFGEFDYGPTTGRLIMDIANGTLPAYVAGNRNVIYAGDAGRGLLLAAEKGRPGERYLLTGVDIAMDDLIAAIADITQTKAPKAIPLWLAKIISKAQIARYHYLKGPEPRLSETAIAVLSAGQFLDGSKAERELGFTATVTLEEAIRRTLRWFKQTGYVRGQQRT